MADEELKANGAEEQKDLLNLKGYFRPVYVLSSTWQGIRTARLQWTFTQKPSIISPKSFLPSSMVH